MPVTHPKIACPRIYQRSGAPTFWFYGEGPKRTFAADTGDVADLARNVPALTRGSGVTWAAGQRGQALSLPGTAAATVAASPVTFPMFSNGTLTATVFLTSASLNGTFLMVGNASTGMGIGVGLGTFAAPGNNLIARQAGVAFTDSLVALGTGWVDVAVVSITAVNLGAPTFIFYINGAAVASIAPAGGTLSATGAIGIGGSGSASQYFPGLISEARFYPRVLSAAEIAHNHADPEWRLRKRRTLLAAIKPGNPHIPIGLLLNRQPLGV